jgi:lipopolysaccharide/colanic/teichoic acid biosynthesis glycosyltransferase
LFLLEDIVITENTPGHPRLVQASSSEAVGSAGEMRAFTFYAPLKPLDESLIYRIVKRTMDLVVACVALALLMPLMILVAFMIWCEDHGPFLYRQARVGRFGVPINFYKFRSMWVDADRMRDALYAQSDSQGIAFKMKDDPRITRVGRFIRKYSIDELPQLFSVLAGHMSIIGPRPLPLNEGYACEEHQRVRYLVKPGLLCYREIGGRSTLSFDQWMKLDAEYVRTRSIIVDLKILVLVVPAVLKAEGAY